MQSNGGLIDLDVGRRARGADGALGTGGGGGRRGLRGPDRGGAGRGLLRHGRDLVRRLRGPGGSVQERGGGEIAGRPLALPMLAVHTVGAGGGSIAWRDPGGALRVGPRSAGADPGPACYGRGGSEPTVTDANLLLGYLSADAPLAGGVELDREAAGRAIESARGRAGA